MSLRQRLEIGLTRDWRLVPTGARRGGGAERLLVIAARPMPTVDYYLRDLFEGEHAQSHRLVYDADVERFASGEEALANGTRVILVRMPSSQWAKVIERAGARVVDVVWLIDDDVAAAREDTWLPPGYRERLLADFLRFRRHFAALIDRVWASTPTIAARFSRERVELRPPRPPDPVVFQKKWVNVFYHGTAAHRREHAFLLPVFEQVQARAQHIIFEIAGDHALSRMFRAVPRVRVLHYVRWPDYLATLSAGRYQIGLAPLFDTPFNRGRSGTKALEIVATGARGILSRRAPYTEYASLPGLHLVGDSTSEWVELILQLASTASPAP